MIPHWWKTIGQTDALPPPVRVLVADDAPNIVRLLMVRPARRAFIPGR
jgi:hypothetical protein